MTASVGVIVCNSPNRAYRPSHAEPVDSAIVISSAVESMLGPPTQP